jgi:hypothetical protein
MDHVDIEDYTAQMRNYGGIWSGVNVLFERKPQLFVRLQRLRAAGYRYKPPEPPT